ncbi:Hypothetical protein NG00_01529 [Corynebacterium camporealensis]|nr:Hypothetical protein NG00_01529 [Corynebacterium camporealensis]
MENSGEWIVDDVNEHKVAQFSTKNRGLRQAILEFDEDTEGLTQDEVIALSWFSRLVQEERTKGTAAPIIISLVLASIVLLPHCLPKTSVAYSRWRSRVVKHV